MTSAISVTELNHAVAANLERSFPLMRVRGEITQMARAASGHWYFDSDRVLGLYLPGDLPLDEVLFFLVIPLAAVLTIEAVRSMKPQWSVGDENPSDAP